MVDYCVIDGFMDSLKGKWDIRLYYSLIGDTYNFTVSNRQFLLREHNACISLINKYHCKLQSTNLCCVVHMMSIQYNIGWSLKRLLNDRTCFNACRIWSLVIRVLCQFSQLLESYNLEGIGHSGPSGLIDRVHAWSNWSFGLFSYCKLSQICINTLTYNSILPWCVTIFQAMPEI